MDQHPYGDSRFRKSDSERFDQERAIIGGNQYQTARVGHMHDLQQRLVGASFLGHAEMQAGDAGQIGGLARCEVFLADTAEITSQ